MSKLFRTTVKPGDPQLDVLPCTSCRQTSGDAWLRLLLARYRTCMARCLALGHLGVLGASGNGTNGTHMIPSREKLAPFLAPDRVFIDIVGQGGAGKTRLALQICDWLDVVALLPWKVQAILVDEEFDDILAVVDGKLKTALGKDVPADWFLKTLLAQGRLCILVERVSERRQATRAAVTRTYEKMSPKILICTSRTRVQLHGTQGFMAALRMNHEAYAQPRKFPPVAFPVAGGVS